MREILFRGKQIDNRAWVYGVPCEFEIEVMIVKRLFDFGEYDCIGAYKTTIDKETVGQYTGLTDKNGNRIFEGDILKGEQYPYKSDNDYNYFAEVCWFENSPSFGLYCFKNPTSKVSGISTGNTGSMEEWEKENWEVIGNIYDNPELLRRIYSNVDTSKK